MIESLPPIEVMLKMNFHYPPEISGIMNNIMAIGARNVSTDVDSFIFMQENVFATQKVTIPLLNRLIELDRIEPLDVQAFSNIVMHYCVSVVMLNSTPIKMDIDQWYRGLKYLYEAFIKPTGK